MHFYFNRGLHFDHQKKYREEKQYNGLLLKGIEGRLERSVSQQRSIYSGDACRYNNLVYRDISSISGSNAVVHHRFKDFRYRGNNMCEWNADIRNIFRNTRDQKELRLTQIGRASCRERV